MVKTEKIPQLERIVREKSTAVDRLRAILKKFVCVSASDWFADSSVYHYKYLTKFDLN